MAFSSYPVRPAARPQVIQGSFLGNSPRFQTRHHHQAGTLQPAARGSATQLPPALLNFPPRSAGQPLPEALQRKMETVFGADFSDVRVHVGPEAASLGAVAFANGSDLYFAHGQYNPASIHGQRLIGHELTHVLQQRSGRVRNPFGSGVAIVQDPGLEAEAERMGLQATLPRPLQPKASHSGASLKPVVHPPREVQCVKRTLGLRGPLPSSALAGTASAATTWVEARINGWSVGKFTNVKRIMLKETSASKYDTAALDTYAKDMLIPYNTDNTKDIPHAEDYLLAALLKFVKSGKTWDTYYPRAGGTQYGRNKTYKTKYKQRTIAANANAEDVLTLYMDKTPCNSCARNLHKFCTDNGLRLRIKAGHKHTDTDPGSQYLTDQQIHVRRWDLDSMKRYMDKGGVSYKPLSFAASRIPKRSKEEETTFTSGMVAEKSWRFYGRNRKA